LQLSDDKLVAEALDGSQAAFETLLSRYEKLVFKVTWSYARQRESALDIAQDVFVKAYRGLRSYRGDDAFKPWLMSIAHNECRTWLRRNEHHEKAVDLETVDIPQIAPQQEDELHQDDTRRHLLDQMDKLNPRQRQALTMRYFEKAPVGDIAQALDCSPGTAKSILFRGLQKMRDGMRFSPLKSSWSQS
jgi:RNA polymerase sigma-70 factor, ECF subfamily